MTAEEKSALAHRVLSAIGTHEKPPAADVLLLHFFYPEYPELDADELACLLILDLAKQRRTHRAALALPVHPLTASSRL